MRETTIHRHVDDQTVTEQTADTYENKSEEIPAPRRACGSNLRGVG